MNRPPLWLSLAAIPFSILGLIFTFFAWFVLTLPQIDQLKGCMVTSMHRIQLCPGKGRYVKLNQISPHLRNAVIASEDAGFFHHKGFDFFEIQQSFTRNIREFKFSRGGSTITQQLAKNAFLTSEKSLLRKFREAFLTMEIERGFSKSEILEKYLNIVEFGPGIYGAQAAARHYFDKDASSLNVLEASFLAFLLPNPKVYSQSFRSKRLTPFARKMIAMILGRLAKFGKISSYDHEWAKNHLSEFPWLGLGSPGSEASSIKGERAEDTSWESIDGSSLRDSSVWEDPSIEAFDAEPKEDGAEGQDDSETQE